MASSKYSKFSRPNDDLTCSLDHIVIQTPPEDIISSIQFSPHPGSLKFLVASWDRNAYLYEIIPGNESQCRQVATFEHRAPVLDVCFGKDDTEIFTAGLDWDVRRFDGFVYIAGCH